RIFLPSCERNWLLPEFVENAYGLSQRELGKDYRQNSYHFRTDNRESAFGRCIWSPERAAPGLVTHSAWASASPYFFRCHVRASSITGGRRSQSCPSLA